MYVDPVNQSIAWIHSSIVLSPMTQISQNNCFVCSQSKTYEVISGGILVGKRINSYGDIRVSLQTSLLWPYCSYFLPIPRGFLLFYLSPLFPNCVHQVSRFLVSYRNCFHSVYGLILTKFPEAGVAQSMQPVQRTCGVCFLRDSTSNTQVPCLHRLQILHHNHVPL